MNKVIVVLLVLSLMITPLRAMEEDREEGRRFVAAVAVLIAFVWADAEYGWNLVPSADPEDMIQKPKKKKKRSVLTQKYYEGGF